MPRSTKVTPLSELRVFLDVDQKNWCEKIGWTLDVLKNMETGRIRMTPDRAAQVSLATGISPEWLLQSDPALKKITPSGSAYTRGDYETAPCSWKLSQPDHPANLLLDEVVAKNALSGLNPVLIDLLKEASRTSRLGLVLSKLRSSIENIRELLPSQNSSELIRREPDATLEYGSDKK